MSRREVYLRSSSLSSTACGATGRKIGIHLAESFWKPRLRHPPPSHGFVQRLLMWILRFRCKSIPFTTLCSESRIARVLKPCLSAASPLWGSCSPRLAFFVFSPFFFPTPALQFPPRFPP